jgi:hypothetical protein
MPGEMCLSTLTEADLTMFGRLGIDEALLLAAQVRRVTDPQARELLGSVHPGDLSGIAFPYLSPINGEVWSYRVRRDHPETDADGKPKDKYLCPRFHNRLYFPPGAGPLLTDVTAPLVIVEAEKSALALTVLAARHGRRLLALALGGCWGWRGKTGTEPGPSGEREQTRGPKPDFGLIHFI